MDITEKNKGLINRRLEEGLALLRRHYDVTEYPVEKGLADPVIGGRPHHARRFEIAGVGNLLLMTVTEARENQLGSFVVTPYFKNLPLFSTDYVYSGEKRFFLLEIYDLCAGYDEAYKAGIAAFRKFGDSVRSLPDFKTRPAWYDDIRPVCFAKAYGADQDDFAIEAFLRFLRLFIDMERAAPAACEGERVEKWRINRLYADRLIDKGGVSTDLFTAALGAENTRRFFHRVFFGADWYKPVYVQLGQAAEFLDQADEDGQTNLQKIRDRQQVIRRTAETDKSKSWEYAERQQTGGESLPGVVLRDGRLTGFGIEIFNKDIYPLQSFEITLRNCGLSGRLDLSGCRDLMYVDIYHNRVAGIDVRGDDRLRILGIQDNEIEALYTGDLTACQGIDAGRNRLRALDVTRNRELVELYINDNRITEADLRGCPKLKYFYCHNNAITELDTAANPLLRHLNATGNPLKRIRALAPQREEPLPLELTAGEGGYVGLKFNPVYNAQWKETGEWQQTCYAYPLEGYAFEGWFDAAGRALCREAEWRQEYGTSGVLFARFVKNV